MRGKNIIWTEEKIKDGFRLFFEQYSRYPTATEIDSFLHLPSSRQLQRRFGGVPAIRERLGLPILDFTKGETRSKKAAFVGKRGLDSERNIRKILIEYFGEIFVHEQKPFNDYFGRLDFFIYAKGANFGVDVFFASEYHNLVGCINNKQRLYRNIDFNLILLQTNSVVFQKEIDSFITKKKNPLPDNIRVMDVLNFEKFIKTIQPLKLG